MSLHCCARNNVLGKRCSPHFRCFYSLIHLMLWLFFFFLDITNTERIEDALKYDYPAINTSPLTPKPGMKGSMFSFHSCCIKRFLIFCGNSRYFGYGRWLSRQSVTGGRDWALDHELLDGRGYVCFPRYEAFQETCGLESKFFLWWFAADSSHSWWAHGVLENKDPRVLESLQMFSFYSR